MNLLQEFIRLVMRDEVEDAREILQRNVCLINRQDERGNTALHYAPSVQMVDMLAHFGAKADVLGENGIHSDDAAFARGQDDVGEAIRAIWGSAKG